MFNVPILQIRHLIPVGRKILREFQILDSVKEVRLIPAKIFISTRIDEVTEATQVFRHPKELASDVTVVLARGTSRVISESLHIGGEGKAMIGLPKIDDCFEPAVVEEETIVIDLTNDVVGVLTLRD